MMYIYQHTCTKPAARTLTRAEGENPPNGKAMGNGSATKSGARLGHELPLLLPVMQVPRFGLMHIARPLALDEVERRIVVAHLG